VFGSQGVGSVDLADTYLANDLDNLYVRNTYHGSLSLGTFIALDVDSDTSTGFDIFSLGLIGSEAGWQNDFPFTQSNGVFNDNMGMSGDYFGTGAALLVPFADVSDRELAISLDIVFNNGNVPVFADDTFDILIWTDLSNGDVGTPISYTLAVPEPHACLMIVLALAASAWFRRGSWMSA
jgi:hypothetical protein